MLLLVEHSVFLHLIAQMSTSLKAVIAIFIRQVSSTPQLHLVTTLGISRDVLRAMYGVFRRNRDTGPERGRSLWLGLRKFLANTD